MERYIKEIEAIERDIDVELDRECIAIINSELVKFMEAQTPIVRRMYDVKLAQYKQELDETLERDIEENGDKEIKRAMKQSLPRNLLRLMLKEGKSTMKSVRI